MSRTTTESKDGVFCNDQIESPMMDEGSSGGSDGLILKKGPWTSAEDAILMDYVKKHGEGNWNAVQKHSGLFRCGKSCRLRWANHLRPNLKKGAFTQEEEQLIIELHAKMGNKWARMAAHLPGRTDNEIKNYWNTRIKRRQRAGLPLYPPDLSMQAVHESLHGQNTSDIDAGDRGQQGLFQSNSYEIPDVIFDGLKVNQGVLPYVPEIPDISSTSMLMEHLGSPRYCTFEPPTLHRQKRIRESTSMFSDYSDSLRSGFPPFDQLQDDASDINAQSFGLSFPVDPDDTNKNSLSFGVIQGSHSLSNGNFSASKPTSEAVKLELPSLQYSETALSSWGLSSPPPALDSVDTFIQSPPSGTFGSDCLSPRNSGLLDALLHEAKTLSSAKNHSSDKSSNSSSVTPGDDADSSNLNISETEWEEYGGPISPLGHSATSLFTECTPLSASGSSLDEQPVENFTGSDMKSEPVDESWPSDRQKEASTTHLDSSRPDALLGSDWFGQKACCADDQSIMSDAIATLLGDDLGSDYMHITTGTSSAGQGWGFGSYAWNKPVCHLSEIP